MFPAKLYDIAANNNFAFLFSFRAVFTRFAEHYQHLQRERDPPSASKSSRTISDALSELLLKICSLTASEAVLKAGTKSFGGTSFKMVYIPLWSISTWSSKVSVFQHSLHNLTILKFYEWSAKFASLNINGFKMT